MKPKNIVVIGDTIIDHYVHAEAIGLSLETPTIKGKLLKEEYSFGGASNVVSNLLALGQKVTFITPVSNSKYGDLVRHWDHANLNVVCLDSEHEISVKSRFWLSRGDSSYKVMQLNQGEPIKVSEEQVNAISSVLTQDEIDLVVLVDYNGGLFNNEAHVNSIIQTCVEQKIKVVSSSQVSGTEARHRFFENSTIICMNRKEALENNPTFEVNKKEMNKLFSLLNSEICVTLGKEGAAYYDGCNLKTYKALNVDAVDTCGAGDSFLAALCSRLDTMDIDFSNEWAARSTLKRGTYVPKQTDS